MAQQVNEVIDTGGGNEGEEDVIFEDIIPGQAETSNSISKIHETKNKIMKSFDDIREALNARERNLLNELNHFAHDDDEKEQLQLNLNFMMDNKIFKDIQSLGTLTSTNVNKSFIVDVSHRMTEYDMNKPIRHVFHVNKCQKVRHLAKMVAKLYKTNEGFFLFYENWNMKVAREYEHNLVLEVVPNHEALACYILKDWNKDVTPQEIKKQKIKLLLAKCVTFSL